MRRNLLLLLFLLISQVMLAQSLSRADVNAYVENQYGHAWRDIALYLVAKDQLDKDNALTFEKTISVSGKTKNQLYVD